MPVLRLIVAAAVVALATAVPLVVGPAVAQERAETAEVKIVDFDFDAKQLTIDVGTTVTWTNTGQRPHTVTDRGGTFDTDPIAPDGEGSFTFSVPGTYSYFCRI